MPLASIYRGGKAAAKTVSRRGGSGGRTLTKRQAEAEAKRMLAKKAAAKPVKPPTKNAARKPTPPTIPRTGSGAQLVSGGSRTLGGKANTSLAQRATRFGSKFGERGARAASGAVGAARSGRDFVVKGAKGQGLGDVKKLIALRKQGGSAAKAHRAKLGKGLLKSAGRTGAVYGGGAAAVGGTGYAVSRRGKRNEEFLSTLEREALQEAVLDALLELDG